MSVKDKKADGQPQEVEKMLDRMVSNRPAKIEEQPDLDKAGSARVPQCSDLFRPPWYGPLSGELPFGDVPDLRPTHPQGGCGTPASAEDRQAGRGKLRSIREKQRFKTHHAGAAAETAAIPCGMGLFLLFLQEKIR